MRSSGTRRKIEYDVWALTVSGYCSATEALERECWRFSEMVPASGWGRVHSYVFANRKKKSLHCKDNLCLCFRRGWRLEHYFDTRPKDTAPFYIWYIRGEWTLQISAANRSVESMLPDLQDIGSGGLSLILPGETREAKSNFFSVIF